MLGASSVSTRCQDLSTKMEGEAFNVDKKKYICIASFVMDAICINMTVHHMPPRKPRKL